MNLPLSELMGGSDSPCGVCPSLARRMGADMTEDKKIRNEALEEAARVLDRRAETETRNSDHHKACARDYKAREAAHVARIARQDAAAIRALKEPEE